MELLGVLPDLLPPGALDAPRFESFLSKGARQVDPVSPGELMSVLTWKVASAPALWLPKLDAIARRCVGQSRSPESSAAGRWLRLAPRYLGRMAHGTRLLRCDIEAAQDFLAEAREQVASGQLGVAVEVFLSGQGESETHELSPPIIHRASGDFSLAYLRQPQSGSIVH